MFYIVKHYLGSQELLLQVNKLIMLAPDQANAANNFAKKHGGLMAMSRDATVVGMTHATNPPPTLWKSVGVNDLGETVFAPRLTTREGRAISVEMRDLKLLCQGDFNGLIGLRNYFVIGKRTSRGSEMIYCEHETLEGKLVWAIPHATHAEEGDIKTTVTIDPRLTEIPESQYLRLKSEHQFSLEQLTAKHCGSVTH